MKQILFLLSFFVMGALTSVNAQSEVKACCKKGAAKKACCKAKAKATASDASTTVDATQVSLAATQAAEADEAIETRTCEKSGKVSFFKKSTCPMSGKVSLAEVTYDEEKEDFVNVSPKDKEAIEGHMSPKMDVKAVKVSSEVE